MIVAIGGFGIRPNCDPKADHCSRYGVNGTYTGRRIVLDSVEMIDPENLDENQWQQGKWYKMSSRSCIVYVASPNFQVHHYPTRSME